MLFVYLMRLFSESVSVSVNKKLVAVPRKPAVRAACMVLRWMESVRTGDCCRCSLALSCNAATPGSLFSLSEDSCGCSCFTFLDTFFYFHLSVLQVIFLLLVCPDRTPFFLLLCFDCCDAHPLRKDSAVEEHRKALL